MIAHKILLIAIALVVIAGVHSTNSNYSMIYRSKHGLEKINNHANVIHIILIVILFIFAEKNKQKREYEQKRFKMRKFRIPTVFAINPNITSP